MVCRYAPLFATFSALSCSNPQPPAVSKPPSHPSAQEVRVLHQAAELTAAPSDMCGLLEQGKLSIVGRFEPCASGALRLSWSGAGLRARFSGTGLRMTHKGPT